MLEKLVLPLLLLGACGSEKSEPTDRFDELTALDTKSDAFSKKMKVVGTIATGQTSAAVSYTKTPRYRAFQLTTKGVATLDFTVRSTDGGDAVAWLLGSDWKVLAKNDDADDTTLDSHVTYDLPAGGATYYIVFRDYSLARHHFVVEVGPLTVKPSCVVGLDIPEEPPVAVARMESLLVSYLSSYQLYHASQPACLDCTDAKTRSAVAEDIRAQSGISWNDATMPVVNGVVKSGAAGFLAALSAARAEIEAFASSSLPKSANFQANYLTVDSDQRAIVGDAESNPAAFLEFDLHVKAEECSQDGHVRIDTRTGEILIARVHGC